MTPDGGGLQPAGTTLRIDFGRAKQGVADSVGRLLGGSPTAIDCQAAETEALVWPDGLMLVFRDGDFRGWQIAPPWPVTAATVEGQRCLRD
ncbi:MAG: hypothetical protein AAF914_13155 [Pseudomonadota bacterium]